MLQGGICPTSEPYIKSTKDPKLGLKVQKQVKTCCQRYDPHNFFILKFTQHIFIANFNGNSPLLGLGNTGCLLHGQQGLSFVCTAMN